jgi:hypothetical protein
MWDLWWTKFYWGRFLRVLRFPLPILIPPTVPHSSSWSGADTIGQLVADVPSGLSLTPPQEPKTKKRKVRYNVPLHRLILFTNVRTGASYGGTTPRYLTFRPYRQQSVPEGIFSGGRKNKELNLHFGEWSRASGQSGEQRKKLRSVLYVNRPTRGQHHWK